METVKEPTKRTLAEMEKVIYDRKWFKQAPKDLVLYLVYRELKKDGDLRYDLTVIPAQMLGKEFVRTKGNYNSDGFREAYSVLQGKAIFFLQKQKGKTIEDVVAIEAKPGTWIMVPPYYTIITINPSPDQTLKTVNWVSEKTKNIYQDLEKMGGPAYFYTKDGWVKNKNYQRLPELRFEKPLIQQPNLDLLRTAN